MLGKKNILGVGITNADIQEVLEYITKGLSKNTKKYFIVTPNPEILTLASKNIDYKNILNKAEIALTDGVGVLLAGRILGKPFKSRVTGVDLLENLCELVAEKPITVGFLGGRRGVAEKTAECLIKKYPRLKVTFAGSEWKDAWFEFQVSSSKLKTQSSKVQLPPSLKLRRASKTQNLETKTKDQRPKTIDVLFVGFGAPKQEIWISENLEKIPVKAAIGVGGAFDYISGKVLRAPIFVRKLGLEWLFRLIVQPWRIKRQLRLLQFMFLVLREKFFFRLK